MKPSGSNEERAAKNYGRGDKKKSGGRNCVLESQIWNVFSGAQKRIFVHKIK